MERNGSKGYGRLCALNVMLKDGKEQSCRAEELYFFWHLVDSRDIQPSESN